MCNFCVTLILIISQSATNLPITSNTIFEYVNQFRLTYSDDSNTYEVSSSAYHGSECQSKKVFQPLWLISRASNSPKNLEFPNRLELININTNSIILHLDTFQHGAHASTSTVNTSPNSYSRSNSSSLLPTTPEPILSNPATPEYRPATPGYRPATPGRPDRSPY